MKVLHLISSGGYYGAESMLLNLCLSQEKAGLAAGLMLFYNAHQPNLELYENARHQGLSVAMVRCKGRLDLRAVREIREHIRENGFDVLHTHGYKADIYGYAAARAEAKPIVATCHNWLDGTAALNLYNRLDRFFLKRFDAVAAVSREVAERARECGIPADRMRVIANGIDADAFTAPAPTVFARGASRGIIGVVARLDLQKGFEYLLLALRELTAQFPDILLLIVGEGPDRVAIEKMVETLGLKGNVLLAGRRTDMAEVYASMDLFALPSLNEGLPMTVLEAMAAAKPVIATRVGAVPDVVRNHSTGLLVEPRDVAGLKEALTRLLADPEMRARLGEQARAMVRTEYTDKVMAARYHEMYEFALRTRDSGEVRRTPPVNSRTRTENV